MRPCTIPWSIALFLVVTVGTTPGATAEVVDIVMKGMYFTEPANVRFVVAVEPSEENRFLWVEAVARAASPPAERRIRSELYFSDRAGWIDQDRRVA